MTTRFQLTLSLLLLACLPNAGIATPQVPDHLHSGIWTHEVYGTDIPNNILYGTDSRPMGEGICTACWRGFIAEWELRDGQLYLLSAKSFLGKPLYPISTGLMTNTPIRASWFNGELYCPVLPVLLMPIGPHLGSLMFVFKDGTLQSRRFQVYPIGIMILLVEVFLFWLVVRKIIRRHCQKRTQPLPSN
jgi:hypothetical protein